MDSSATFDTTPMQDIHNKRPNLDKLQTLKNENAANLGSTLAVKSQPLWVYWRIRRTLFNHFCSQVSGQVELGPACDASGECNPG